MLNFCDKFNPNQVILWRSWAFLSQYKATKNTIPPQYYSTYAGSLQQSSAYVSKPIHIPAILLIKCNKKRY